MAQRVGGASPVTFSTTAGQYFSIPLLSLQFGDDGAIDASGWPPMQTQPESLDARKRGGSHGKKLSAAERRKLDAAKSEKLSAAEGDSLGLADQNMLTTLFRNMVARKLLYPA